MKTNKKIFNFENTYEKLPESFYSPIEPTQVKNPDFVIVNEELCKALNLDRKAIKSKEGLKILSGNKVEEGSKPLAQAYAGHQFGHFTMLGDGRAILLGEIYDKNQVKVDLQLKASGPTPYSRRGDGRGTLRAMLREYIISEAMHALNIPTTRSLAVINTGQAVYRERPEKGGILVRTASSHIRVGTFEYALNFTCKEDLKALADYSLERHYPSYKASKNPYLGLLKAVIRRQASLIAKWQSVGFIHGVMNTDNMAISGETIDYGPCAFMDAYNLKTVFSSIDHQGRYAYGNQPYIGGWNLGRFAESLIPLIDEDYEKAYKMSQEEIASFNPLFQESYFKYMTQKIGVFNHTKEDERLILNLLQIMSDAGADFTNTFRALSLEDYGEGLFLSPKFKAWKDQWQERLKKQGQPIQIVKDLMKASNPGVIPRNHKVEEALDAGEQGDYRPMESLLKVLKQPFDYERDDSDYIEPMAPSQEPYRTYCGT
jgi:uncharacterized protein YdiU (UPF0061 family)